jgi:DNA-directed RNA polymerase subunit RPC12/RpoP
MEKYYKVSDINEILNKLAKEPAYYHEGEDFYNGVCAVEGELMCLEQVPDITSRTGRWVKVPTDRIIEEPDRVRWKCSSCGKETDLPNYEKADFCFNCGAKMKEDA